MRRTLWRLLLKAAGLFPMVYNFGGRHHLGWPIILPTTSLKSSKHPPSCSAPCGPTKRRHVAKLRRRASSWSVASDCYEHCVRVTAWTTPGMDDRTRSRDRPLGRRSTISRHRSTIQVTAPLSRRPFNDLRGRSTVTDCRAEVLDIGARLSPAAVWVSGGLARDRSRPHATRRQQFRHAGVAAHVATSVISAIMPLSNGRLPPRHGGPICETPHSPPVPRTAQAEASGVVSPAAVRRPHFRCTAPGRTFRVWNAMGSSGPANSGSGQVCGVSPQRRSG